jgi:inner membrane protein
MIRSLIREREHRNDEAATEISDSWSLSQTLTGPYLSIPLKSRNTYHKLPETLIIKGNIVPIEKKRGIFTAVVYNSKLSLSGSFSIGDEQLEQISEENKFKDKAYLCIGISDLRGIGNLSSIELNGTEMEIEPGLHNDDVLSKGIHVPLDIDIITSSPTLEYTINIELKGSSELFITPMGKKTDVTLTSSWPDPSFTGKFLPGEKNISADGFTANWAVNYLNRNYPQSWYDRNYSVQGSSFGVSFLIPVDHYQKSERSVKYAFMFIALSFLVFFLTEVLLKTRIHPIQYLLVGFALIIFYTLLVPLAEHIGFNLAYLISTVSVTMLVGTYMKGSTHSTKVGLISALLLTALYGFLFTTLQLQELSLLMGSIGMFIILSIIMIVSRRVNWYKEEETE